MIHSERLTRTFLALTAIDSETYHERAMADHLKECLTALGISVEEDGVGELLREESGNKEPHPAGNLIARLPGTLPGDPILFCSHMDTVKPGVGKKAILHEDGTITSSGDTVLGADDAAGLAEILEMLTVLVEEDLPHRDLEIVFPVAEELFTRGSKNLDYSKLRAKDAYILDLSGPVGAAAWAAPSILAFEAVIHGKSAHAGFAPETGVHAVRIAADAIARIDNGHVDENTTVNVATIHGGILRNVVPDEVVVTGEARSLDHDRAEQELEKIGVIFREAAEALGGTVDYTTFECDHAYRTPPDAPVVRRFQRACEELGFEPVLQNTFGGSDNNRFALHGIQGIVLACAMNDVHSTAEWTSVSELTKAAEIILKIATLEDF